MWEFKRHLAVIPLNSIVLSQMHYETRRIKWGNDPILETKMHNKHEADGAE